MVFDGKKLADKVKADLAKDGKLVGKKLLIIQADGEETESAYVGLKRKMGENLGVEVAVVYASGATGTKKILESDLSRYNGIMVQLPIFGANKGETAKILSLIPIEKDVDGLNQASQFLPAVIVAVEKILTEAQKQGAFYFDIFLRVAVVGARGVVGARLVSRLRELGYVVMELDKGDDLTRLAECDVVISATGEADLIKPRMVMDNFVAIDLGYPKPDFEETTLKRAVFVTPVPGGAGPVTIVSLYENLTRVS